MCVNLQFWPYVQSPRWNLAQTPLGILTVYGSLKSFLATLDPLEPWLSCAGGLAGDALEALRLLLYSALAVAKADAWFENLARNSNPARVAGIFARA